jgi:hypothetical protein
MSPFRQHRDFKMTWRQFALNDLKAQQSCDQQAESWGEEPKLGESVPLNSSEHQGWLCECYLAVGHDAHCA